jgi:hypothetical protein
VPLTSSVRQIYLSKRTRRAGSALPGRANYGHRCRFPNGGLLQARASKAKVIGLANAGGDTINSIKQAGGFGIVRSGQSLAGLLVFVMDSAALGLPTAQGLAFTEAWSWDMNDDNPAWSRRWQAERPGKFPTMIHAGAIRL